MFLLLKNINTRINVINLVNAFSTSSVRSLDQKYREQRKLTRNPNRYGILTSRADYSFTDGRPTPIGVRLRTRMNKQRDYAKRILKLTNEVDYAVERHNKILADKEMEKQMILDRKLKPKGDKVLVSDIKESEETTEK